MIPNQRTKQGDRAQVVVVRTDRGWEVREQQNDTIVRVTRHADWHRVELSVQLFELRNA
jgi:hypothetical protein